MVGNDGGRLQGLVGEESVYAALDAIHQALQRSLTARSASQRRRELAQLRGILLTLPSSGFDLEGALRHLVGVLREPILEP